MAGVLEMLKAAEFKTQQRNAGDPVQTATKAITSGLERGAARGIKQNEGAIDQALKVLKLRDLMQEMKRKQEEDIRTQKNDKYIDNLMKGSGKRPFNASEEEVMRSVNADNLGSSDVLNSDKVKSGASKITDLIEEATFKIEGSKGRSVTVKRKPMPAKKINKETSKTAQRKLAIDYAKKERAEALRSSPAHSENGVLNAEGRAAAKSYDPSNDEVQKYMGAAKEFLTGAKRDRNIPLSKAPFIQRVPTEETPTVKGDFFGLGFNPAWNEVTQLAFQRLGKGTEAEFDEFIKNADKLKAQGIDVESILEFITGSISGGR